VPEQLIWARGGGADRLLPLPLPPLPRAAYHRRLPEPRTRGSCGMADVDRLVALDRQTGLLSLVMWGSTGVCLDALPPGPCVKHHRRVGKMSVAQARRSSVLDRLLCMHDTPAVTAAGGKHLAPFSAALRVGAQISALECLQAWLGLLLSKCGPFASLPGTSRQLVGELEGARLVDLAESLVQLIVRNLYERTADVRWWATDPSLWQALYDPNPENVGLATERLGVIHRYYTVYSDLVLVDARGRAVATANPLYRSKVHGLDYFTSAWFQRAIAVPRAMPTLPTRCASRARSPAGRC